MYRLGQRQQQCLSDILRPVSLIEGVDHERVRGQRCRARQPGQAFRVPAADRAVRLGGTHLAGQGVRDLLQRAAPRVDHGEPIVPRWFLA